MAMWTWLTVLVLLTSASANAQARQTISAAHTYLLGDNDSKSDARQACFLEAKRKVIEQAGVYIEGQTVVKDLQLTKSEVVAYSAAVLRVETVREEYGLRDGRATLACAVKADVDIADVERRLAAIAGDKSLQTRIKDQQDEVRALEQRVRELNARVNMAPVTASGELRKERNVVFGNLTELENKKLAAIQAITAKTELIRQYVVRNMTVEEVVSIAGQPRTVYCCPKNSGGGALNYGDLWVCFQSNIVTGVGEGRACYPNLLRAAPR